SGDVRGIQLGLFRPQPVLAVVPFGAGDDDGGEPAQSDEVGEHRERRAVLYQEGADGPGGGDEDRGADDGPEPRADGDRRAGTETDLWGFGLRREEQFDPFGSVAGHPLRLGLLDSPLPHVVLDGAFEQRPEMLQDQVALPRVETVELLDD